MNRMLFKAFSHIVTLSLMLSVVFIGSNAKAANAIYLYEWVSQSGTISSDGLAHEYTNLQPGQSIQLSLTLKNQSGKTIHGLSRLGPHAPSQAVPTGAWGIGSQTPYQDGTPNFLDLSSFVLNNNRFVYYDGEDVNDGEAMTMTWTVKLRESLGEGTYNLYVRPVSEYLAWTRQVKNGRLLPSTSSDIFWKLVVGSGGDSSDLDKYAVGTFTNTKEGYSFSYYPGVKDQSGWGMVGSNDFGVENPSQATQLTVTDRGGWDDEFEVDFHHLISDNLSDSMSLRDYATQVWLDNKNITASPDDVVGPLEPNSVDGQMGYKFYLEGSFDLINGGNTGSGWMIQDDRAAYVFFRTKTGKILTVEYTAGNPVAEMIVNSIRLL